jgi:hypothetical protein
MLEHTPTLQDPEFGNKPKFVLFMALDSHGKFHIRYAWDFLSVLAYSAGLLAFLSKLTNVIMYFT